MAGQIRKFFPGGNTSRGFYSFFHHIIDQETAKRIISLKGGPGVGKSSFMRGIGEKMLELGYHLEYHFCSSDSESLDALVIPALGVAIMDGTAPHVLDPELPGAVGEIINLGQYWNEEVIKAQKSAIENCGTKISRYFKMAYWRLGEAKAIKDEVDNYYRWAINQAQVNGVIHQIARSLMDSAAVQFDRRPKERHLFSSAFTPQGYIHHLPSLLQNVETLHLVSGEAGGVSSYVVGTIAKIVHLQGIDSEVYHYPLVPEDVDLLVIPSQRAAVLREIPELNFIPQEVASISEIKVYNLNQYLCTTTLATYRDEINDGQRRFAAAINGALKHIASAKAEHDVLENYYIPAMDFNAINDRRNKVLEEILQSL